MSKFQTIKIWRETLRKLYFIRAYTSESIVAILERLVNEELVKVSDNGNSNN